MVVLISGLLPACGARVNARMSDDEIRTVIDSEIPVGMHREAVWERLEDLGIKRVASSWEQWPPPARSLLHALVPGTRWSFPKSGHRSIVFHFDESGLLEAFQITPSYVPPDHD